MSKRALLVGINDFGGRPEWALRGCVNDSIAMREILQSLYGFSSDEIRVLNDADATTQAIQDGFAWLLNDYSGGGQDVRLFHFASHGTQIAADSDDEEDDELDELIVPYDHDWKAPFTDDRLRQIFEQIPEDVNFTFLADCCHSGSINKAPEDKTLDRYVEPPQEMQRQVDAVLAKWATEEAGWIEERMEQELAGLSAIDRIEARGGLKEKLKALFLKEKHKGKTANTSNQVLVAAARDDQTAADAFIDGMYRGAFTWSLAQAIRSANGNITYQDLWNESGRLLANYTQDPQLDASDEMANRRFLSPVR